MRRKIFSYRKTRCECFEHVNKRNGKEEIKEVLRARKSIDLLKGEEEK